MNSITHNSRCVRDSSGNLCVEQSDSEVTKQRLQRIARPKGTPKSLEKLF